MTIIMFMVACGTRTPISLWATAMICDTLIILSFVTFKILERA